MQFVVFDMGFYGEIFGVMVVSGDYFFFMVFQDFFFEVKCIFNLVLGQEVVVLEVLEVYLKMGEVYVFIFEFLVMGVGGMIMYEFEIFSQFMVLCKKYGVFCIVDEVMMGFGWIGCMFVCDYLMEQLDIMCLLKGLIGGILFFVVMFCMEEVFEVFWLDDKYKIFFYGYFYMANLVGCVVVLVSFDFLELEGFVWDC